MNRLLAATATMLAVPVMVPTGAAQTTVRSFPIFLGRRALPPGASPAAVRRRTLTAGC